MFKSLLKVQLKMLFSGMFKTNNSKTSSTVTKAVLFSLLYLFLFCYIGGAISFLFLGAGALLLDANAMDLYFPIAIILSTIFGMMGTMMSAEKLLFEGKDNELLLSMPIPQSYILGSRLISLAILESVFSLVVLLPAVLVYYILMGVTFVSLVAGIVGIVAMLVPPLVISIILGRLLSEIHSRAKNKKIIDTLSYFLFFGAYLAVVYQFNPMLEYITEKGADLISSLKNFAPLLWWGNAMIYDDILSLLGLVAVSAVLLVAAVYVLSRGYTKLITRAKNTHTKQYKEHSVKIKTPQKALLAMEFGRFFGTPIFIFNCGLGVMMSIIAAVMLVVNRDIFISGIFPEDMMYFVPTIIAVIIMFVASTVCPSCVSISIEGKYFPMIKTFPINCNTLFFTKILMNMIIALPNYTILPIVTGIGLNLSILDVVSLVIFGFSYQLFLATAGLLINLKMPKMDWTNIAMVVKQSGSITTVTLSAMGLTVLGGITMFVMSMIFGAISSSLVFLTYILHALFFAALFLVCFLLLKKYGEKLIGKI